MQQTVCFRPADLPWITLHLKVPVALTRAEAENPAVIPHKAYTLARIHRLGAEGAVLYAGHIFELFTQYKC